MPWAKSSPAEASLQITDLALSHAGSNQHPLSRGFGAPGSGVESQETLEEDPLSSAPGVAGTGAAREGSSSGNQHGLLHS